MQSSTYVCEWKKTTRVQNYFFVFIGSGCFNFICLHYVCVYRHFLENICTSPFCNRQFQFIALCFIFHVPPACLQNTHVHGMKMTVNINLITVKDMEDWSYPYTICTCDANKFNPKVQ